MGVRDDLRRALTDAMRRRDTAVVAPLRSAIAEIDNAESVDPGPVSIVDSPIAGSAGGVGAAEVTRAHLSEQEQVAIVEHEIVELTQHVERLTRLCRRDEADATRRAITTLRGIVQAQASTSQDAPTGSGA